MEKSISLILTAHQLENMRSGISPTAVVYDVLRASSTIITALANGAHEIRPVLEPEEARQLYKDLSGKTDKSILLGGERKGEAIPGFHLGNSPLEYTREQVCNKTIIMTTTNGTRALINSHKAGAKKILIAGFLNQGALVESLRQEPSFTIVCAGIQGQFAYEDFLSAGLMLHRLLDEEGKYHLDDGALAALGLAKGIKNDPTAIFQCFHGRRLIAKNRKADVEFCATVDRFPVLPVFQKPGIHLSSPVPLPGN